MIEKEYGHYIVACDVCTNEMGATFDTWQDAVDGMKKEGYQSMHIDGRWIEVCPECQEVKS